MDQESQLPSQRTPPLHSLPAGATSSSRRSAAKAEAAFIARQRSPIQARRQRRPYTRLEVGVPADRGVDL